LISGLLKTYQAGNITSYLGFLLDLDGGTKLNQVEKKFGFTKANTKVRIILKQLKMKGLIRKSSGIVYMETWEYGDYYASGNFSRLSQPGS
jgi:hypothetical protein